jgi:predicted nucleic acid-binding protein
MPLRWLSHHELTEVVSEQAGRLAARRALRGSDAVHLASVLAVNQPGMLFAVWDECLRDAAHAEGVQVVPAV